jgi:hypothetical protein
MIHALTKLLTLSPENVSMEVYWALGSIYIMLWIAAILSVVSKRKTLTHRLAWILLVTFVPVLGIALHCLSCLVTADYQFLKQFGLGTSKAAPKFQSNSQNLRRTSSQPSS